MNKVFLSILFLIGSVSLLNATTVGFSVVEENNSYLILTLDNDSWSPLQVDGGTLQLPAGAGVDSRAGGIQVPYFRRMIGLPSNRKPQVRILEQQWSELEGYDRISGTSEDTDPKLPHLSSVGTVYVGEPILWRNHYIAPIHVIPVDLSSGRKLDNIKVRIDYNGSSTNATTKSDILADGILLNPTTASRWVQKSSSIPELDANVAFPEGELYRMEIRSDGLYALTYEDLVGSGINLSGRDPRSFRIYGNGGLILPEEFEDSRPAHLMENSIIVEGEEDGSWDPGDRILFYAFNTNTWKRSVSPGEYRHQFNPYTSITIYWLNIPDDGSSGKRMESLESSTPATFTATTARSRTWYEKDQFIFYRQADRETGKDWYMAELYPGDRFSQTFSAFYPVADEQPRLWFSSRKVESGNVTGIVNINNQLVSEYSLTQTVRSEEIEANILRNGTNTLSFEIEGESGGLLDWYEISYWRELNTTNGVIEFDQLPENGVANVVLSGIDSPWIFDVQDYANVKVTRNNPFRVDSDTLLPHRYVALSEDKFKSVSSISRDFLGRGEYPDGLHDPSLRAQYIMIVHEDFWAVSQQLEEHIEQRDGIEVIRVDVKDIYKEFAWGQFDPTAIRDFLYWAQQNWTDNLQSAPAYCLFIGDGDYDYRNIVSNNDKNWIPPYENGNESRDDFYVEYGENVPSYVTGRLPFQSESELNNYIEGLLAYDSGDNKGSWQNRALLVADDEWVDIGPTRIDQNHITDSENLSANYMPEYMQIDKIYVGTYPTSYDPATGARLKPLATRSLINSINDGALIVNYMGHGNAHVWAHESVFLDNRDRTLVNSGVKRPIYIAATCAWGHYDRPDNEAFFEMLLGQRGGAIGVVAASRNTSGGSNERLLQQYFPKFFDRELPVPAGETLLYAKLNSTGATNHYYHYFGEPAMRPALPRQNIAVTDIAPDSLISLESGQFHAEVIDGGTGSADPLFSGEALVTVLGGYKSVPYTFMRKEDGAIVPGNQFYYNLPLGLIFRGYVSVNSGNMAATFMVPKDVTLGSDDAVLRILALGDDKDAVGALTQVPIATTAGQTDDATPPEINIFFDHLNWRDGDLTSKEPRLILDVMDSSGVNLTGEIGHQLKVIIDGGRQEVVLTQEFTYKRDSYFHGSSERILFDLEPGMHHLEAWAWDNANNLARKEATFITVDTESGGEDGFYISNVYNVPNPFSTDTHFTFEGAQATRATVKIFTATGRQIQTLEQSFGNDQSFYYIPWDGNDQYNDQVGNGVYLYKLFVVGASGQKAEETGKVLRAR
ncbi:type IX secretion system sortase PorU [bacterium]|nr:type IX secretion system sortase PorU [bacterium]